jgi:phage/plasmid-associated DNA primase
VDVAEETTLFGGRHDPQVFGLQRDALEFREGIRSSDFITDTIPFDYNVPDQEDLEFVRNVMFKICNANESHLNYYLSSLGYSLLGRAELEKAMFFLVGQKGDNGKTLILDALKEIAPCYIDDIDRKTFQEGYAKAHKHLKSTRGKRIVYVEELAKAIKQNVELLKQFGDGKSIKNEIMFGTEEKINLMAKLFVLSNHTPTFNADGGIQNRYRQIQFDSSFKTHYTEDDYESLQFVQDNTLADKLKGQYKMALLYLLMTYSQKYEQDGMPPIPSMFQEKAQDTIDSNDPFKAWFDDNCEIDPSHKAGKEEVVKSSKQCFKNCSDELKRLGFDYKKGIRYNGKRGCWEGFKVVVENMVPTW